MRGAASSIFATGADNAPDLAHYLETHGAVLRPAPADAAEAVRRGRAPFVLLLPQPRASAEAPLDITLLADASRLSSVVPIAQIMDLLHGYEHQVTAARIEKLGIAPDLLRRCASSRRMSGAPSASAPPSST